MTAVDLDDLELYVSFARIVEYSVCGWAVESLCHGAELDTDTQRR